MVKKLLTYHYTTKEFSMATKLPKCKYVEVS